MANALFRKKHLSQLLSDTETEGHKLRRALTVWDLIALGIGCIIGVGVFVLPGSRRPTTPVPASSCPSPSPAWPAPAAPSATPSWRP